DRLFVHLHLKEDKDPEITKKLDALTEAGHPLVSIEMESKQDIAQELYRWEMAVAAAGAVMGINAFNQPNVQGSKDDTKRLLKQVEEEGSLPDRKAGVTEDNLQFFTPDNSADNATDLLQSFLRQVRPGDYIAIQAYLTEEPKTQDRLQELRTTLQQQLKLATTIGYGPRFLHSTGQFHKGGPNTGLFIQLTADAPAKLEVPATNYTFGTFIQAQAEGNLQALREEDRRVISIDLKSNTNEGLEKLNDWVAQIDLSTVEK